MGKKKNEVVKPKIALCSHVFNHISFDVYFNHMWCVAKWVKDFDLIFVGKSGLDSAQARNGMIERCFEKEVTHVFFMDGDHYFPSDVLKLLYELKDEAIVSGLVCKRGEGFQQVGWIIDSNGMYHTLELPLDGQVYDVAVCAFGCTLINLEKLKKLKKPYFRDTCEPSVDGSLQNIRSDVNLCNAFRDIGEKVWIDTRVLIGHDGIPCIIYPQNSRTFRDLKNIEVEARKLKEGQTGIWYNPHE